MTELPSKIWNAVSRQPQGAARQRELNQHIGETLRDLYGDICCQEYNEVATRALLHRLDEAEQRQRKH